MAHLDPGRYDRSEYGYEPGSESPKPRHWTSRHGHHCDDEATQPPEYWPAPSDSEPYRPDERWAPREHDPRAVSGDTSGGTAGDAWRHSFGGFVDGPPAPDAGPVAGDQTVAALNESTAALAGMAVSTPPAADAPAASGDVAGGPPATTAQAAAGGASQGRAGRNLRAAIGVGLGLGGVVMASLLWRPAFVVVVMIAVAVGTWEMARAVGSSGSRVPLAPLIVGGPVMVGLAWWGGAAALPYGLLATALAVLLWRIADGASGYQRDVTAAILIATYVPFLASFAVLLVLPEDDGGARVLVTLVGVVLSDTGGYVTGVFFGRHPMAPSVSPKKSWEGFAGSLVWTAAGSALLLSLLLDAAWWHGVVFGVVVSAASVLGDLSESLIKRDLGVKDMSNLLPGHGGLMDRLDSILLAAPAAYAVLAVVAPATS